MSFTAFLLDCAFLAIRVFVGVGVLTGIFIGCLAGISFCSAFLDALFPRDRKP